VSAIDDALGDLPVEFGEFAVLSLEQFPDMERAIAREFGAADMGLGGKVGVIAANAFGEGGA
jgi:hypothetical protein